MSAHKHTHQHINTNTLTYIQKHIPAYAHKHTHQHINTNTHTSTYIQTHTPAHTYKHTHQHIHTNTHTSTYIHTNTHRLLHTYLIFFAGTVDSRCTLSGSHGSIMSLQFDQSVGMKGLGTGLEVFAVYGVIA